tara:strand:+ start:36 stop:929 length:894 start_codon:yes stop_codon:yes gene_type:complete
MIKWLGNHVVDFIARFRNDVYLERISTGTIASGAHLGLDSNNKIVKAADGGGDLTSIVAGTGLSGTSLTGPDVTLNVDASQTQITSVGTIGTGVWNGDAISHAYVGANAIETDNIADAQVTVAKLHADAVQTSGESFADNDTSLMTSAAIDDAIIKGGSVTYINILPHEFLADEGGGGNKSAQYDDTDAGGGAVDIGVGVGSISASLFGFADIPVGKTATHVTVFGSNAGNAITVYESNVKTGTLTSKGTGDTDTGDDSNIIDITDVAGTSTNYLVIKSAIGATTNTIYGAQITISG